MTTAQLDARAGEPLLEVDDLRTFFDTPRGVVKAVDGVSLRVDRGRTLGIVGESGSGKTVLSRSIMNLLPKNNTIREGSVRFEGRELTTMKNKEMRRIWGAEMAMVLQDPMTSLNPVTRIGDQITESLGIHLDEKGKVAKAHAVELLRSVGIPAAERRLGEYPHQLSGGMRQRVTIAIALACGPKLLVADEPTTALDVTVQRQILDLLAQQQAERNMGMIIITHDLGVVAGRADEIAVMYAGRIVERAPTRELFARYRMPYTEGLLRSIPRLHQPSHTRLAAIPGRPPDLVDPPAGCAFAPRCNYAQERCLTETPPLAPHAPGHEAACHFPVGTAAGKEALERNLAAGRTAAGTPLDAAAIAAAGAA
ncbi:ABC transporter ATP-binding protein [Candidatus Blastococcus massiliensis]|uniref:ABC transporter ATP-binding protein n=1 Tax=Candidatus Blastococcus massiliensis TaxID=1470358 RepID=UPI0004B163CE|nr:ABC transporter ATP-binding protein [Candidatus Blastococcus massiliensis]